jgi:hypothetical protein
MLTAAQIRTFARNNGIHAIGWFQAAEFSEYVAVIRARSDYHSIAYRPLSAFLKAGQIPEGIRTGMVLVMDSFVESRDRPDGYRLSNYTRACWSTVGPKAKVMADFLKAQGYRAEGLDVPHRSAACCAGLGFIGRNAMFYAWGSGRMLGLRLSARTPRWKSAARRQIRNAVFSNIVITGGGIGIHLQSAYSPGPGVAISNVTFRDMYARNVALPFQIVAGKPEATAQIENIVIDDYHAEVFGRGDVKGNAHTRPRKIRLRNIDLTVVPHPGQLGPGPKKPHDTLLKICSGDDVALENVCVEWRTKDPNWQRALQTEDVTGLRVADSCHLPEPSGGHPDPGPVTGGAR